MIELDLSIGIQTPQSLSARSPRKIKLINQVHQLKKENIQLNKETQSLQETSKAHCQKWISKNYVIFSCHQK
jgi:hypothetical protein